MYIPSVHYGLGWIGNQRLDYNECVMSVVGWTFIICLNFPPRQTGEGLPPNLHRFGIDKRLILQIASLTAFVDEVLNFYRTRFLIGEKVEIASTDKGLDDYTNLKNLCLILECQQRIYRYFLLLTKRRSSRKEGMITDIMVNPDAAFHHPNQIVYKCCIVGTSNHVSVTGNKLWYILI